MNFNDFRVLVFDLESVGHHSIYIKHLLNFYSKTQPPFKLILVVSPEFILKHHEMVNKFDAVVQIVSISQAELLSVKDAKLLSIRTIRTWSILKRYTKNLNVDHSIVMWLDHVLQFPLALQWKFPCAISGICFRPMFHYLQWQDHTLSLSDRLRAWRQKILYFWAVRHPQLHTLFCLDPFVPKIINQFSRDQKAVHLPDPVTPHQIPTEQQHQNFHQLKACISSDQKRKTFLFFGAIAARKGIYKCLEALNRLDKTTAEKVTLLLVGEIVHNEDYQPIMNMIEELKTHSSVHIDFHQNFVTDKEMANYFSLSDIILAPYQEHVGMSGILLQAAAAGKPVISSNYGLMGQVIRSYSLGLAVDTTQPTEIAEAITQTFASSFSNLYSLEKMQQWVSENSPEEFSNTIFNQINKQYA